MAPSAVPRLRCAPKHCRCCPYAPPRVIDACSTHSHAPGAKKTRVANLTREQYNGLPFAFLRVQKGTWLLRCVGSARIHAASRIDVHEIYSFSITCQSLSSNLIKSLDIFAPNGAWCPLNLIKRP